MNIGRKPCCHKKNDIGKMYSFWLKQGEVVDNIVECAFDRIFWNCF